MPQLDRHHDADTLMHGTIPIPIQRLTSQLKYTVDYCLVLLQRAAMLALQALY